MLSWAPFTSRSVSLSGALMQFSMISDLHSCMLLLSTFEGYHFYSRMSPCLWGSSELNHVSAPIVPLAHNDISTLTCKKWLGIHFISMISYILAVVHKEYSGGPFKWAVVWISCGGRLEPFCPSNRWLFSLTHTFSYFFLHF